MKRAGWAALLAVVSFNIHAQNRVPPYDLWTPRVLGEIRDRSSLELSVTPKAGYWDLFFTSNASANWFEDQPPYAEHQNEKIRIHGYLVAPPSGGPYPALVLGHGHGGHADLGLAQLISASGYVVLAFDGPQSGLSTGGPRDHSQAWISVDKGPQYGFLYHWSYAGMRCLTVLEQLATVTGNPHRIEAGKLGIMGISMGGILTAQVNGIDDRVKAAVVIMAAGPWHHLMRYPNSWLYNSLYTETRDTPDNGSDPLNSIENVDSDPTTLTFENYFDPIRYTPRQNAPVFMVIGTHDDFFPMPTANLMQQAITSSGRDPKFQKRLWLLPNAGHGFDANLDILSMLNGVKEWLGYCFGSRDVPLAAPQVSIAQEGSGLRLDVRLEETAARLEGSKATVYAATRVDSTAAQIRDFKAYDAVREGGVFVARIPPGETSQSGETLRVDNTLYFATVTDRGNLPVTSLLCLAGRGLDLSSNFSATTRHIPTNSIEVPLPPPVNDSTVTVGTFSALSAGSAYQGLALTNPTDEPLGIRVEARTVDGRIESAEGLINPIVVPLPPLSQQVFVAEEWFGAGARRLSGSFFAGWSNASGSSLGFRGDVVPADLEGIGPMPPAKSRQWIPLIPEQDGSTQRHLRLVAGPPAAAADVQIVFRSGQGTTLDTRQIRLAAGGSVEVVPPTGSAAQPPASAEIRASVPVSARLELRGSRDSWSVDGLAPGAAGASARLVQPHLEMNGIFASRIVALNSSTSPQTATLRIYSKEGAAIGNPVTRTIPALGVMSETAESLLGNSIAATPASGWFALEVSSQEVAAAVLAVDPVSGAAAGSVVDVAGTGPWSLPYFVEVPGYFTGLAAANPGDSAVNLTLVAYGDDGSELARNSVRLGSGQSRTALISQWFTTALSGSPGHIVLTADGPLSLLSYFGTDDGASLAAIPIRATASKSR